MPKGTDRNGIRLVLAMLAFFSIASTSCAQSGVSENIIVTYPIHDYLSWSTGNEIPWTIDFEDGYKDKSSLKSGPIECVGTSSLKMNIFGPSIIKFKWKTDTPSGIGQLIFKVDTDKTFECNSRDWTEFSYPLSSAKAHELEWIYRKIKSYPIWSGAGWVDELYVINLGSTASATAYYSLNNRSAEFLNINQSNILPKMEPSMNAASISSNAPNINLIINNFTYVAQSNILEPSTILVRTEMPTTDEMLSSDSPICFFYRVIANKTVTNCTLFLDDQQQETSRNIETNNSTNEFMLDTGLIENGIYRWYVKCCESGRLCNSSEEAIFRISNETLITRVNQHEFDKSRFVYPSISEAINKTKIGGIVIIENGTYNEQILIDKPLKLIGKNRPCLIFDEADSIIAIAISNVEISGLEIRKGTYGISIDGSNGQLENLTIKDNEISESSSAIWATNCTNCTIINNTISNCIENSEYNSVGIELIKGSKVDILLNKINLDYDGNKMNYGIYLNRCDNYTISKVNNNILKYCSNGIGIKPSKYSVETLRKLYLLNNKFIDSVDNVVSVVN